jgi:xanthine dehydrogenase accessory factor
VQSLDALAPHIAPHSYVLVATMNTYDEEAVEAALKSEASYVGVVASMRRFAAIQAYLADRALSAERIARLKRPKGTAGSARIPGEIAFSVLAELLEARHQRLGLDVDAPAAAPRATATDPICGMTVDVATARYITERDGQRYYFCCAGCQQAFEAS